MIGQGDDPEGISYFEGEQIYVSSDGSYFEILKNDGAVEQIQFGVMTHRVVAYIMSDSGSTVDKFLRDPR